MMKIYTLIIFSVFSVSLFSQEAIDPLVNWTERHRITGEIIDATPVFICGNENSFISFYKEDKTVYLVKTDKKTDVVKKLKVETKGKDMKRNWEKIFYNKKNDQIYLFSYALDKKDKCYRLYVESIDQQNLIYREDVNEIGSIKYDNEKKDLFGNIKIFSSPNNERVLISYAVINNKRIKKFIIRVLDGNMNQLWCRESDFPYIDGNIVYVDSYEIDDNGNVYVMQNRPNKSQQNDVFIASDLFLTHFPAGNEEPIIQKLEFDEDKWVRTYSITCGNNIVICSGLYTIKGEGKSAFGDFSFMYNVDKKTIGSCNTHKLEDDFLTSGMLKEDAQELIKNKNERKEFDDNFNYTYIKRYQRKDGGFTTVFEKFRLLEYGYETDTPNPKALRTIYAYDYNDIMIFTYNADGSLRWKYKIPRSQRFIDKDRFYGSSSVISDDRDNIQIFYLENNWKKKSENTQPILYVIDNTGNGKFYELFSKDDDARKYFSPTMVNYLENGKYLLGQIYFPKFGRSGTYLTWGISNLVK